MAELICTVTDFGTVLVRWDNRKFMSETSTNIEHLSRFLPPKVSLNAQKCNLCTLSDSVILTFMVRIRFNVQIA